MRVLQLNLFPIKSTRAYRVEQAIVQQQGLNFDREFMITEPDGSFITARKVEGLYRLSAFPISTGIVICNDRGEQCVALYRDFVFAQPSTVWGKTFFSLVGDDTVNRWLSEQLGQAVQLRWLGEESQRKYCSSSDYSMSFADSYPLSLVSVQSLEQVKKW